MQPLNKSLFIVVLLNFFAYNLNSQINCEKVNPCNLYNSEVYYSFSEPLNIKSCENFILSKAEKIRLREGLTGTILSFVNVQSSQNLSYNREGSNVSEKEIFNSFVESSSIAILYNPKFELCKSNGKFSAIVYVEKDDFDDLALKYFVSQVDRLYSKINILEKEYKIYPNKDFQYDLVPINNQLKRLSSFYILMLSLKLPENNLIKFKNLESKIENFRFKINSLEKQISEIDMLIDENQFLRAYDLLRNLESKFKNDVELNKTIKRYKYKLKKIKREFIKSAKQQSSSHNNLSFDFGVNSGLINTTNHNGSSMTDALFPYFQSTLVFNDRDKTFGFGPYFRLNLSNELLKGVGDNSEYVSPFNNSYTEAGIWLQYFLGNTFSVSIRTGPFLEEFVTEDFEELSFWNLSAGISLYNQSNSYALKFTYNRVIGQDSYSYNSFNIGYSKNFKISRKISTETKKYIDENFKTY